MRRPVPRAAEVAVGGRGRIENLEGELNASQSSAAAMASERDDALAEVERIRLKYDPEIRAELQAEYDAALARACTAAKEDVDAAITSLVDYDDRWEPIGTSGELNQAVADCAAGERAKTAAQRQADRLAACQTVDVDAMVKNPSA